MSPAHDAAYAGLIYLRLMRYASAAGDPASATFALVMAENALQEYIDGYFKGQALLEQSKQEGPLM